MWQSGDPIFGKYLPNGIMERDKNLPGMGGVYNSFNLGLYSYGHLNPVKFLDPDGRETWFIGGAGVNGSYIKDMTNRLSATGIRNVRAATPEFASFGNMVFDAALVIKLNKYLGDRTYSRYQGRVHLNLPKGEQLNLIGYSYGSVVAAQTALAIAAGGQRVDNVVLIGAPINQDLLDALKSNKNIGNVHVINLTEKGDPIYAGMPDIEIIKAMPTLIEQQSKGTGHFYYAPETEEGAARRSELAKEIKKMGLE